MTEDEQKLCDFLKLIKSERRYTGEAGEQYHEGATIILDLFQEKTELTISKLKDIREHGESEKTGTNNDWVYRLLRYLIRIYDTAAESRRKKENWDSIFHDSIYAYSGGFKGEAKKSFPDFAPLFALNEEELEKADTFSKYVELLRAREKRTSSKPKGVEKV